MHPPYNNRLVRSLQSTQSNSYSLEVAARAVNTIKTVYVGEQPRDTLETALYDFAKTYSSCRITGGGVPQDKQTGGSQKRCEARRSQIAADKKQEWFAISSLESRLLSFRLKIWKTMWKVTEKQVQVAGAINAVAVMAAKWLTGVLVGKLISSTMQWDNNASSTPYMDVILLNDLSFQNTAILSMVVIVINTLAASAMSSLAVLRSAETGRSIRRDVLKKGVGALGEVGSSSTNNMSVKANELTVKIKIIEDFQAHEEHWLLFNWIRLALCIAITFLFTWYGALLGLFMIVSSEVVGKIFENKRTAAHTFIEKNAKQVSNRLLDVIKNSVIIKMTCMANREALDLNELEKESDAYRMTDAWYRFCRDTGKILLVAMVPPLIVLLAWPLVLGMEPEAALATGTSILVTMLLLDEGHKSLIYLQFVYDRHLAATEALEVVEDFIEKKKAKATKKEEHAKSSFNTLATEVSKIDEETGSMSLVDFSFMLDRPSASATAVVLEKITLSYNGRSPPVLDGYCNTFERGKIHALVGESGSGKSSAMKVIANLIAPESGSLHLWRGCKAAYISQDQKLFARTVRENVTYGCSSTRMCDADIWAALEMAHIDAWVRSLPNGLEEELVQGENTVSGGQLQRLQLAYLFCTGKDADLVMLDECLSALDKDSREFLIKRLDGFLVGKTAIIVTHHSEMLRMCDVVHTIKIAK